MNQRRNVIEICEGVTIVGSWFDGSGLAERNGGLCSYTVPTYLWNSALVLEYRFHQSSGSTVGCHIFRQELASSQRSRDSVQGCQSLMISVRAENRSTAE